MSTPIPDAALDDRLGIVGTAGSGKTYNAGGCVERLLSSGARCIIVDPLDVWWGLRLLADGKTASPFNVVILGGQRGDLPLNELVGGLIGETVAKSAESFIVSLGTLGTKAAERRFMLAFLTALYRHVAGEPIILGIRDGFVIRGAARIDDKANRKMTTDLAGLHAFAVFDGFENWPELAAFWRATHGAEIDTFTGWHIRWLPLPAGIGA